MAEFNHVLSLASKNAYPIAHLVSVLSLRIENPNREQEGIIHPNNLEK